MPCTLHDLVYIIENKTGCIDYIIASLLYLIFDEGDTIFGIAGFNVLVDASWW